jgi:hypothetical protein
MADNAPERTSILQMLYNYANETPSRVPLSDWFDTLSGAQVGFTARTVVGGLYANALLFVKEE